MTKLVLWLMPLLLVGGLSFCTREDGLPDPPVQQLVPCNQDAGTGAPLACPPGSPDAGATQPAADGGLD